VIDERWNGGGNIEQELLAILVQHPYQIWQPRGTEPTERPFSGLFRPQCGAPELAERQQRRDVPGRLPGIGAGQGRGHADDGAVIRDGELFVDRRLDDRTPGVGVFLADSARTEHENHAVQPDVLSRTVQRTTSRPRSPARERTLGEVLKGNQAQPQRGGTRAIITRSPRASGTNTARAFWPGRRSNIICRSRLRTGAHPFVMSPGDVRPSQRTRGTGKCE